MAKLDPVLKQFWLTTSWWCENDKTAQRFLRGNLAAVQEFDDIQCNEVQSAPRVDIISGGFPCQPFSVAGLNHSIKDPQAPNILPLRLLEFVTREHTPE